MRDNAARLDVQDGQYWIGDAASNPVLPDPPGGSTGLVGAGERGLAIVLTGTQFGHVRLRVQVADNPPELECAGWDDVAEVSLQAPGRLTISSGGVGLDRLSNLLPGPGSFRLRVHARGRDAGAERDVVSGRPVEEHLIQVWPALPGPDVTHKATDGFGKALRGEGFRWEPGPWHGPEDFRDDGQIEIGRAITATSRAAAVLKRLWVQENGCLIQVVTTADVAGLSAREAKLARDAVDGRVGGRFPDAPGDGLLRAMIRYPDGRTADSRECDDPAIAQSRGKAGQAVISTNGICCYAEGDHHVSEADFWCWPLPPAETFELTIDWQAVNIPQTPVTLDGAAINAVAERVRQQPQTHRA